MCGRIICGIDLCQLAENLGVKVLEDAHFVPSFNITPSTSVPVLNEAFALESVTWGFKIPIAFILNARYEELSIKPLFKPHLNGCDKRCVIVCEGFYEWKGKIPYVYRYKDSKKLMLIAALIMHSSVVLLTRAATQDVAHIHDRMPVIFDSLQLMETWLDSSNKFSAINQLFLKKTDYSDVLNVFPVAPNANDISIKDERCLEPYDIYKEKLQSKGIMRYFQPKPKEDT